MENVSNIKKIVYSQSGYRGWIRTTTFILDIENFTLKRYFSDSYKDKGKEKDYDDPLYGKIVRSRKLRKKKECFNLLSKLKSIVEDWHKYYRPEGRIYDGWDWSLKIQFCDGTLKETGGFCLEPENFKEFSDVFFQLIEV